MTVTTNIYKRNLKQLNYMKYYHQNIQKYVIVKIYKWLLLQKYTNQVFQTTKVYKDIAL